MAAKKLKRIRLNEVRKNGNLIQLTEDGNHRLRETIIAFGKVHQRTPSKIQGKDLSNWVVCAKLGSPKLECPDCGTFLDFLADYRTEGFSERYILLRRLWYPLARARQSSVPPSLSGV